MSDSTPITKGLVLHSHARYYDFVARLLTFGHGDTLYERLVDLARLEPDERVLDVGCGTGSLALAAKARVGAGGTVHGIDASREMMERASRKTQRRRVQVDFQIATVEALPFPECSFDVVFSTLMLHHLPRPVRRECAGEIAKCSGPAVVFSWLISRRRHPGAGDGWRAFIVTASSSRRKCGSFWPPRVFGYWKAARSACATCISR